MKMITSISHIDFSYFPFFIRFFNFTEKKNRMKVGSKLSLEYSLNYDKTSLLFQNIYTSKSPNY
jgi:hypothetical protein